MKKKITAILMVGLLLLMLPMVASAAGVIEESTTGDGTWDGDVWSVSIYPGETKTTSIHLYNSSSNSCNIEAAVIPDSLDNGNLTFKLSKTSFTMPTQVYTDIILTVRASGSATPGTYTAQFEIASEIVFESLPSIPSTSPDTTPPVISDVWFCEEGVTGTTAHICWTTNDPSTSQIEYWSSPSQFSPLDATYVTEHHIELTGLTPDTTYYYRTMSENEVGNLAVSDEFSFTTLVLEGELEVVEPEPEPVDADVPIVVVIEEEEPEITVPSVDPKPVDEIVEPGESVEEVPVEEEPIEEKPIVPATEPEPVSPWGLIIGILVAIGILLGLWKLRAIRLGRG